MQLDMDFEEHNAEVKKVWEAFNKGNPIRVPIVFNFSHRFIILNRELNPDNITFEQYMNNPELMIKLQLALKKWLRFNVLQDMEMGSPKTRWEGLYVDLQNIYDAAWFGCSIKYIEGDVPDTIPMLQEDKNRLYELELPDPIYGNLMGRAYELYEQMSKIAYNMEYEGLPVGPVAIPGQGTDGPFTAAASLRGATEICLDLYEDPNYVHELLDFITSGIILRMKAWMDFAGREYPMDNWGFADDSAQLLSTDMYREFILPYHKRLYDNFAKPGSRISIHLCGDAQHLFPTLRDELNVYSFDTGFPTDLARARMELGPDVLLRGNIHPELLRVGPPEEIEKTVKALLQSGVMEGGRFILCEGNNVAPFTPPEHLKVMFDAGRKYGKY